jgi:hypothetical protein
LGRRLLSEYSARYSIFVELLIFITNERAPPTRVKKTIRPGSVAAVGASVDSGDHLQGMQHRAGLCQAAR